MAVSDVPASSSSNVARTTPNAPAPAPAHSGLGLRGSTQHPARWGSIRAGGCAVEWISDEAKARIAELGAEDAPAWVMRQETGVSRHAVLRQVRRLRRRPKRGPTRSPLRLSLAEAEEISRGLASGESLRAIASRLQRTPSTVTREVGRNGGRRRYRACAAERAALRRTRRPKRSKLAGCERLRNVVEAKLELRWSPQQIPRWLVGEFPGDPETRVSQEPICLPLFVPSRCGLRTVP